MRRADDPAARARARAWPLAALLATLLAAPPRPCGASNVFAPLRPGGDRGIHGGTGPHGRHGHSAVTTGRHVTVFGGRSEFRNGDFLNDLWVYDVDTGDWTAGSPNELVCAVCEECQARNPLPSNPNPAAFEVYGSCEIGFATKGAQQSVSPPPRRFEKVLSRLYI